MIYHVCVCVLLFGLISYYISDGLFELYFIDRYNILSSLLLSGSDLADVKR